MSRTAHRRAAPALGWVGTGLLGSAIAERLLDRGRELVVFNRTPAKSRVLARRGARIATSLAEVADRSGTIFLCLFGPEALKDVLFHPTLGLVANAKASITIVDTSTVGPDAAMEAATRLARLGHSYVEAPVSGGPERARCGTLTALLAGEESAIDRVRNDIGLFASTMHQIGTPGRAQVIKLVNNLAESVNLLGAAEAVAIAEAAGIETDVLRAILPSLRGYSTYLDVFLAHLERPDAPPSATVGVRLKDLGLIRALAVRHDLATQLTSAAERLYSEAAHIVGVTADQANAARAASHKRASQSEPANLT